MRKRACRTFGRTVGPPWAPDVWTATPNTARDLARVLKNKAVLSSEVVPSGHSHGRAPVRVCHRRCSNDHEAVTPPMVREPSELPIRLCRASARPHARLGRQRPKERPSPFLSWSLSPASLLANRCGFQDWNRTVPHPRLNRKSYCCRCPSQCSLIDSLDSDQCGCRVTHSQPSSATGAEDALGAGLKSLGFVD